MGKNVQTNVEKQRQDRHTLFEMTKIVKKQHLAYWESREDPLMQLISSGMVFCHLD